MKEPNDELMGPRTQTGSQTPAGECPWGCDCCTPPSSTGAAVPWRAGLPGWSEGGLLTGHWGLSLPDFTSSVWKQADIIQRVPKKARGPPSVPSSSLQTAKNSPISSWKKIKIPAGAIRLQHNCLNCTKLMTYTHIF